ncbi:MAG: hypothetical protein HUU20_04570 [Pirellulales bacterium]|nr:hypothetical protein [Pirellulales bacterium]
MNAAAQAFFNAVSQSSLDDANSAVHTLSGHFELEDMSRAAFLALICGALVERGCDPLAMAAPLTTRLASLLESSAALANACSERIPEANEEQDRNEAFQRVRAEIAAIMPKQNAAWVALEQFWRPAIAVFAASSEARAAARLLRDWAAQISDYHEAGHWLRLILSVLDNEPVVVIEPERSLGILGRISGIVDNFQLNTLLMDVFPRSGLFSRSRVSQRVADVARGRGPQQTEDIVTSVWNLYTWRAIQPDLTLPDPKDHASSAFWIWNEGSPEDIPLFEGRRAVLLGPPSYPRSWQSQRTFGGLSAEVICEQSLKKDEVRHWLQRMLAAKAAS